MNDVSCHVNIGPLYRKIPVLFETNPKHPWLHGIELSESLITVPRGGRVHIPVENTKSHNITLRKKTLLGQLYLVISVTSNEVTQQEMSNPLCSTKYKLQVVWLAVHPRWDMKSLKNLVLYQMLTLWD